MSQAELRPCPFCGGTKVKAYDCGYTSFNVATAECENPKCKHALKVSGDREDAVNRWNEFRSKHQRKLYHWLHRTQKKPSEIVAYVFKHFTIKQGRKK